MESRNAAGSGATKGRKRRLLTFSEVTDAFVEGSVRTARDAWVLAKRRKQNGDPTLWNTLGGDDVPRLVSRVLSAWHCESMTTGTLMLEATFQLSDFIPLAEIDAGLPHWLAEGHKKQTLFLSGAPGIGKTELAITLMAKITGGAGFHFINAIDRVRDITFTSKQGLIYDEAYLGNIPIDEAKNLLDVAQGRDIKCRHKDGRIPAMLPRIFSTNWDKRCAT